MNDDDMIQKKGFDALLEKLDAYEATRFIMLIRQRPPSDYTKEREKLFEGETIESIFEKASALRAETDRQEEMRKAPSKLPKAARRPPKAAKKMSLRRKPAAKRPVRA